MSATAPMRQRLSAFWRWWMQELRPLVPPRFSSVLGGVSRLPLVMLRDG